MRHEDAWTRLPDLLDDRDDAALLAHVRECATCQRQLFLLGRVDHLLRDRAAAREVTLTGRFPFRRLLVAAAAVAGVAVVALTLLLSQPAHGHEMVLRTPSGLPVGHATMRHSDARNDSLGLSAQSLPVDRGQMFVLWARHSAGTPMQVGHFMVDRRGSCRVHFNLPASDNWSRFWITRPGTPAAIVAST